MSQFRPKPAGAAVAKPETWRDRAEALALQLEEMTAERDDLQERLDEIAQIASPDESKRLARVESALVFLAETLQQSPQVLQLLNSEEEVCSKDSAEAEPQTSP